MLNSPLLLQIARPSLAQLHSLQSLCAASEVFPVLPSDAGPPLELELLAGLGGISMLENQGER